MVDFAFSKQQVAWKDSAREFASKHICPHLQRLENDLSFRYELFKLLGCSGFFTLAIPGKDGHVDTIGYLNALIEISKADAGIGVATTVTNMVAASIATWGTPLQKEKYLPEIAKGKCVPCSFALTEINAGSDAKAVETEAVKSGADGYILRGEKRFITNADSAGAIIVIARTNLSVAKNHLSAFLVDRGCPGLTVTKIESKLGLLTANLVGLRFNDCPVKASQMLGKEGEGLKIALKALDGGRLGVAAQSIGIAKAAFEAARDYSMKRNQFGSPICDQQAIAFKLADMAMDIHAGELLLLKAAWQRDQGLPYTSEASQAKLFCSEMANRVASDALQIHGGCGYTKDYPVEKYFRDARVTTLYEGTSEIQRLVIARSIVQEGEGGHH